MSSTEELSLQSVDSYCHHESYHNRRKSKSSPANNNQVTAEVQEDIENLLQNVPEIDRIFTVLNKIGSGTFSSVYVAKLKEHPNVMEKFALKHIVPTSHPSRIESELRCLQEMGGAENVMGVKACIRHKDHVVIVMPYFHHDKFQDYVRDVTPCEVQQYMKNLFLALKCVHDHNMIHRDVKPSNFLVNRSKNQYSLVDFGLAQKCTVTTKEKMAHIPTPILPYANKSQPIRNNLMKHERRPLSPKHMKSLQNSSNLGSSPRKRKLNCEVADLKMQSPSKRSNNNLEHESDTSRLQIEKENPDDQVKNEPGKGLATPPVNFSKCAKKSPRRQLLMKRTGVSKETCQPTVVVSSSGKAVYKSVAPSACRCFGQGSICNICLSRLNQVAPRAGTPGFRAPEVLMKCPDQTTAVDIWSAGVICLSLLSGRYPFFKADDDMSALAQIISVVGSQEMKLAAQTYGKELVVNPTVPTVDYRIMCQKLRGSLNNRSKQKSSQSSSTENSDWSHLPNTAWDLLAKTLDPNPETRINAADALNHRFLTDPLK